MILVVEDDETVGAGLTAVLAADGHEVGWARTAADARRRLPAAEMVLLDLGLPDADGLELCGEIRDRFPELVVVVVVTARTDEADAVRALDGGADDFVVKPFRPDELLARLRAHLRSRGEAGPRSCEPDRSGSISGPGEPGSAIGRSCCGPRSTSC